MTTPHPLQAALDRAGAAIITAVDLLDIARERKPTSPTGREGRTDARQVSLYRAVVAATVAAIEESFESMTVCGLQALGTPTRASSRIAVAISKGMQSPNPQNLDNLMGDYLSYSPAASWSAHLAHSQAMYRRSQLADATLDYRLFHTNYNEFKLFAGKDLSDVLGRYVRIRNSFAHQDTSSAIFTKPQEDLLKRLAKRKASSADEISFVEALTAICAVTLDAKAPDGVDPIVRWTLHETHAVNALLMYVGLIVSTADGLAVHLDRAAGVPIASFDRLTFQIQTGRWWDWNRGHAFGSTNVDFELVPYQPSKRK